MSGSIKDNITFGNEYNHEKMVDIVKACGLVSDLNELSDGLDTQGSIEIKDLDCLSLGTYFASVEIHQS